MQPLGVVGRSIPQIHSLAKSLGAVNFASELRMSGMLYGKVLRSPLAHARIIRIDVSRAKGLPGVKTVLLAQDTPGKRFGISVADQLILAQDKVRFVGDALAALAAIDEDTAEEAVGLIEVEYEELPAVFDPEEALKPQAPLVHGASNLASRLQYHRGDVEQGFRESDYLFENRYTTQVKHQMYMERRSCLAAADPMGRITVWGGFQSIYHTRQQLAAALDMPESKVRVIQPPMGGGFGGKHYTSKPPLAALLAIKTEKPVMMVNSWADEFQAARPRAPGVIEQKMGVKKDGTLVAREIKVIVDCGAYLGNVPGVAQSMSIRAENLYRFSYLKGEGLTVYTNNIPTGACRGFGNPEGHFALESQLDEIACQLDIDPIELRMKNAVQAGQTSLHGWKIGSCGLKECLERVADISGWWQRKGKSPGRGLGLACAIHHSGYRSAPGFAGSSAFIKLEADGRVTLIIGEGDMGQGAWTALLQIAAQGLGARFEDIQLTGPDSEVTPDCLGAYAARVTVAGGKAVLAAAADAQQQMMEVAAELLEANPEDLQAEDSQVFVKGAPTRAVSFAQISQQARCRLGGGPILGRGKYDPPTQMPDKQTMYGNPSPCYAFTAQIAEVEVDEETGQISLANYAVADDIGRPINPILAEGQIEGCIGYGFGLTLTEEMVCEKGRVINPNFMDYRVPVAPDLPAIRPQLADTLDPNGPFGAKSASEISIDAVPAAIVNAIYDALGVRIRSLPITAEKVLNALKRKG